ncbi:PTS mannose/fructose/sorbose/N-acetylgalactosamine transporter subunit IIC [Pediococcus ethanolidurans]|uniref:PTS system, mannose-specific IIC component n=1 Tax=Pediococcus ethanolidurans TaxID=319653 RepID=A0A0R2K230_9LACO|nr:PTS sugar transporter subunit IIC [Pediococcus ethanolidurans]KRN83624.1 hypothetical protein IV87_GL000093 [Pediococcus ethanolidurans]GEN94021.1 PTS mannose transporter subunit IIC [Pediococcus ethanolidurans]SER02161.1 PTS system, mannose-specific IIC component [Pediococcus ethanolidurans]
MLKVALLAALTVFICYGGNWLFGQTMIERPLVVGMVTGFIMGDLHTGIIMGASLEAIFMGAVDIGGALSAEPVTATVLATTFSIIMNVNQKAALALAVPIGVFAAFISMFLKNVVMNIFVPIINKQARENNQKGLTFTHFFMWFLNYFIFSLVTFFGVLEGAQPVQALIKEIPDNLMAGLSATGGLLPAVGFAILMRMLWSKELSPYYFLGFVMVAYLNLPSIAVAVIGVIIVILNAYRDRQLLQIENNQKKVSVVNTEDSLANSEDKEEEDFFE